MRTTFHAELDELMTDLARMVRLAAQMMINASIALHQTDLARAELVIADRDQMNAMHDETERRCISLLALQAPVAGDLRVVVAVLRAVGHVKRMGHLARHVATVARLKHPNPMISGKVRPVGLLPGHWVDSRPRGPRDSQQAGFLSTMIRKMRYVDLRPLSVVIAGRVLCVRRHRE